ncbi:E3 ubiquitin-protein ligase Rnf220-like isoform X3 [Microplitis mediator]|uniref:E3 ubiquitin-protein ligase Rnf220-like isoform X3 n=1 Tax=Microplitis mediator TaxID=375433 RepID=UPI00255305B3|nr:E3 ubiquitin-protein ligase Rnf220-like isoform X3 [Microplitis mediator]
MTVGGAQPRMRIKYNNSRWRDLSHQKHACKVDVGAGNCSLRIWHHLRLRTTTSATATAVALLCVRGTWMDNSSYLPNHLPPPSLVVFSQAGGLPDGLRMQRPFNPQVTDSKELQVPFSTAASLGYGLHHMLHLPHQFLHPLDPRLPFGAFRPLGPSAFAPPSKCLKVETGGSSVSSGLASIGSLSNMSNMFSPSLPSSGVAGGLPGGPSNQEVAPQSPAGSASRSPLGTGPGSTNASNRGQSPDDDDRDTNATPGSENTERSTPEEGRPYRRKKKFSSDPSCCPVCGVTVRPQELEQHFAQELDRLYKVSVNNSRPRQRLSLPPGHQDHQHGPMLHAPSTADGTIQGRWETYKRIRANRQARIRVKNRKRKADEPVCPVCSERLSGTPEELNQHVERCLAKHNGGNPGSHVNLDDEEVDVEGDAETFEEYEWAGQRRIRASSMLVGGFSAAGLATSTSNRSSNQEEEEDLVVDGDDAAQFGPAQYSEADVIAPRGEGSLREQKERDALREAVISPNAPLTPHTPPDQPHGAQVDVKSEPGTTNINNSMSVSPSSTPRQRSDSDDAGSASSPKREGTDAPIVDALRNRIRELENEMRGQPFKCLICMEQYKKPVTSVCCWHVHCEQCWLHTLGAKKLCPQCNMITSPSDLRRIYM